MKNSVSSVDFTPLGSLLADSRLKHYPKGQIILHDGDTASELLVLKSGIVKIYDIDEQGNEKILHLIHPPAIVPVTFFSADGAATSWFYGTLTDSDIYVLSRAAVEQRMRSDDGLAAYLVGWFTSEMHELLVRLSSLGKSDTRDKLLAALKFLAVYYADKRFNGWRRVTFPVNHQLLADMIGMTRESTATVMKQLGQQKIVRHPRLTTLEINFEKILTQ